MTLTDTDKARLLAAMKAAALRVIGERKLEVDAAALEATVDVYSDRVRLTFDLPVKRAKVGE